MQRTSFIALVVVLLSLPVLATAAFVAHPGGRRWIAAMTSPAPVLAPRSSTEAATLPTLGAPLGAESVELRTLREDTPPSEGLVAPLREIAPSALFAEASVSNASYTRPGGLSRPQLPARDDPMVDAALERIARDPSVRARLQRGLLAYASTKTDVDRIVRAWRLPADVIALALVESSFVSHVDDGPLVDAGVPSARANRAGAWGLGPDVAHVYGLSMLDAYDERRGITSGTEAAAHHLADLRERFGSWELALVAFGFGYRPLLDELDKHGSRDFWQLAPQLPVEVRDYVARVVGVSIVLANLERFGLETPHDALTPASELEVAHGTALSAVADAAGIGLADLRTLNPEYTGDRVPTTHFRMVVRVPSAKLVRTREMLPRVLAGEKPTMVVENDAGSVEKDPVVSHGRDTRIFYRAKEGDTLASLSRQYDIPVTTIASDNALDPTGDLKPGMLLGIRVESLPVQESDAGASARPKKTTRHGAH